MNEAMRVEDREWRVVCAHFPDDGHQLHKWVKMSDESAEQSVLDANHKAEIEPTSFYSGCAPYKAQHRLVMEWVDE